MGETLKKFLKRIGKSLRKCVSFLKSSVKIFLSQLHVVDCSELPQPEHGSVMCDYGSDRRASFEDVCQYSCEDGFDLVGSRSRSCLSTGMWSNDEPTCRRGVVWFIVT